MKKPRLGQHFLIDTSFVAKALQAAEVSENDAIIEVGPGKGILTKNLLKKAGRVVALELDERLANRLHEKLGENRNLEIKLQDARYVDWSSLIHDLRCQGYSRIKMVSNLPYYLASQMVIHLLACQETCDRVVIMVQDEVGRRMCADPGGKDFGAYSVTVQYYAQAKYIVKVPARAFSPPPRVSSAIIRLDHREQPLVEVKDPEQFFYLVHAMFSHRRKTLRNCLQGSARVPDLADWEAALNRANIDPRRRPETVSIPELARIFLEAYPA